LEGDFLSTLPAFKERMGRRAILAHVDAGSDNLAGDARFDAAVAPLIDGLMQHQTPVSTDRAMSMSDWDGLPLPPDAGD
jgi:hypothetical protein